MTWILFAQYLCHFHPGFMSAFEWSFLPRYFMALSALQHSHQTFFLLKMSKPAQPVSFYHIHIISVCLTSLGCCCLLSPSIFYSESNSKHILKSEINNNKLQTSIFDLRSDILVPFSSMQGTLQYSPSSCPRSRNHPDTPSFISSEMPNDNAPMKSLRDVRSQSQTSTESLLEWSSGAKLLNTQTHAMLLLNLIEYHRNQQCELCTVQIRSLLLLQILCWVPVFSSFNSVLFSQVICC